VECFPGPRGRGIDWSMAEQLGRIRQRPDGRCYVDFGRAGKVYSSRGAPFRDERDARHVLEAIRALVAQGVDLRTAIDRWLPATSAAHRVDRWLERWLRRIRERVESGERSAGYLAELDRWCGPDGHIAIRWAHRSVHEIDYAGLDEWVAWLASERKLSAKTRWNVVAAMSAFLGWLRKVGEITVVPAIPWPTVREHAPRLLSAEAQRNVLAAIPEPSRGIFLALALLGLRPSEAARLRAADYAAGDPGWLTIRVTKNRQVKRLPVPDELADWIAQHVPRGARLKGSPLFALPYRGRGRRPAGPWTKTSMRRVWKAACIATDVEISLYEGTKHSRATDLLRQGVSERVLQALLGHRDARSTRRYARLADEALVDAIRPRCGSNVDPLRNRLKKQLKNQVVVVEAPGIEPGSE